MNISIFWLIPAFGLGFYACYYEHIIKPERKRKKALEIAITNTIDNPLEGSECE